MSTLSFSAPADAAADVPATAAAVPGRGRRLTGLVLTGLATAFLVFDTVIKLTGAQEAIDGTVALGWQPHHLPVLAALEAVCLVLYLIPRTAPLGALLWTGYLGGALAANLRLDHPLVSHVLFPVYVAVLIWGGLYLRDARVRALVGSAR